MAADYYDMLDVARDATEDEIKKAYRRLARRYHPDANPGDAEAEQRFKEVAEAYAVLSDPARRRDYDMFGTAKVPTGGFDPFDLFRTFFGGDPFASVRREKPRRGNDLMIELEVTLEETVKGATRTVAIRKPVLCERCGGVGAEPGTSPSRCGTCGGAGMVRNVQRSVFGNVMTTFSCPDCAGSGERIDDPCRVCMGMGRVETEVELPVDIPAGIEPGTQWRITGEGEAGPRGTPAGDLYVGVDVIPDERFERHGDDLVSEIKVPFTKAVLGGMSRIDTFEGPLEIEIEPGTQTGEMIRLKGRGVPRLRRGGRGDLLLRVDVEVPRDLPSSQEELLRRFAAERDEEVSEGRSLMGKIRGAFKG